MNRSVRAGVAATIAFSLIAVGWHAVPGADAQGSSPMTKVDGLWRDIHVLDLMRELQMTAQQRKDVAAAIGTFEGQQKAVMALAQPDELDTALDAIRASLLRGDAPTPEQWQTVHRAQPPDDGSIDQAFVQARETYLTAVKALLTEDQIMHLTVRPMVELANEMLMMAVEAQQVSAAEREEWRMNAFPELREQLATAAGDEKGIVLADFQSRIDHLFTLTPQQIQAQREPLVTQIVTTLNSALSRDAEVISDRVNEQLVGWAEQTGIGELLTESAAAMEAQ